MASAGGCSPPRARECEGCHDDTTRADSPDPYDQGGKTATTRRCSRSEDVRSAARPLPPGQAPAACAACHKREPAQRTPRFAGDSNTAIRDATRAAPGDTMTARVAIVVAIVMPPGADARLCPRRRPTEGAPPGPPRPSHDATTQKTRGGLSTTRLLRVPHRVRLGLACRGQRLRPRPHRVCAARRRSTPCGLPHREAKPATAGLPPIRTRPS
jgi:hypothetical protein